VDVEGFAEHESADGGHERADARAGRDQSEGDAGGVEPQTKMRGAFGGIAHVDGELEHPQTGWHGADQHLGFKQESLTEDTQREGGFYRITTEPTLAIEKAAFGEKFDPVVGDAVPALVGRGGAIARHVADAEDQCGAIFDRTIEADRILGEMLRIGIEGDEGVDPPAIGDGESGAKGRSLPAVVGVAHDERPRFARDPRGLVGRAVVDDPHLVEAGEERRDEGTYRGGGLKCRQDGDAQEAQADDPRSAEDSGWRASRREGEGEVEKALTRADTAAQKDVRGRGVKPFPEDLRGRRRREWPARPERPRTSRRSLGTTRRGCP
jgi:hypothetical protein